VLDVLRRYINVWVIAGTIAIALVLLCVLISVIWFSRPEATQIERATAVFNIIPYFTPTLLPTTPSPSPTTQLPGGDIPPSPPPGEISSGEYVQVIGTGGDGLRLRSEPGLKGKIRYLGLESEIFRVDDGPTMLDGYTWWLLVAPYDENVQGWAVSNYLKIVPNP
jgi:hypothetical protein